MWQLLGGTRQVLSKLSTYDFHHVVYGLSILSDELDLLLEAASSSGRISNTKRRAGTTTRSVPQAGIEPECPEDRASDISSGAPTQDLVSEEL